MNKWKACLELVRFPNLFTAMADIMAGGWIAYGIWQNFHIGALLSLIISSACLYAMGVALNDYMDHTLDKMERPERPLPSGRINRSFALALICILGICGLGIAFFVGWASFMIACALVACIYLYNGLLKKHHLFGPVTMGICRGLNLLLGISMIPSQLSAFWWMSLIPFVYIAMVTALSKGEVGEDLYPKRVWTMSVTIPVCSIAVLFFGGRETLFVTLIAVLLFLVWTFRGMYASIKLPNAIHIRKAVGTCIIGLPLLNAAIATSIGGMAAWLAVTIFMLLSYAWSRAFSVT